MSTIAFQASYYEASCVPAPIRKTPSKLYRDSSGRVRVDHYIEIGSQPFCLYRWIYDPNQNATFLVNDANRVIQVSRYPAGSNAVAIGLFPIGDQGENPEQKELGSREIEGFLCQGCRFGRVEYWISEQLGITLLATEDGEVRMRIADILLREPDPELFVLPADYRIQETRLVDVE